MPPPSRAGSSSRSSPCDALVEAVRSELERQADAGRAPAMQAYMKSAMPYRGVASPVQRTIYRRLFAELPLPDALAWKRAVLTLWRDAAYREERYAAIELSQAKRYAAHQTLEALPIYEELISTGAWWDYVDSVATHSIGGLLRAHAAPMGRTLRGWSRGDDMWKRRSAIICQVSFKADTDLELLYAAIEPNLDHKDFFIRKAIGWALRSYAWTDAHEIVRWVRAHQSRLSGLSKREALKNVSAVLGEGPGIEAAPAAPKEKRRTAKAAPARRRD